MDTQPQQMSKQFGGQDPEEESLKEIFDYGMKLFDNIDNTKEPMNTDTVQSFIKNAISAFEKCTNLVSVSGMFSSNESVEELPTETLQYLLLPALLGTLTLNLCGRQREDVINVADIYFKDFLQRCKDYGVTDIEVPHSSNEDDGTVARCTTEQAKITQLVQTRDAKIKYYKESKMLKERLATLSKDMESPIVDDETKREYFLTLLKHYINQALDEIHSMEQERPILEYMTKHGEHKPSEKHKHRAPPLAPVIITRDALQKAVYGAGYPAIPAMTIEEFYDNRVKEGLFPGSCTSIPHTTVQSSEEDADEAEKIKKENEGDDPEALAQARNYDEYKDDHRRGWGNRHNRS